MDEKNSLFSAVRDGRFQTVKECFNSLAPPSKEEWSEGYSLLRAALEKNHGDITKFLLANDCKVNCDDESSATPLHYAAANGDVEIFQTLIDREAEIDAVDVAGQTALHYASEKNQTTITTSLLKCGALVDAKDVNGLTPLHVAAKENCTEIVAILLNHKACINSTTYLTPRQGIPLGTLGYTPLHYAVENGHEKTTKLLLQNNASVHVQAQRGTPLHIAADQGNLQMIGDLLNHGACVNSVCKSNGYTPLHNAFVNGTTRPMEYLLVRGANVNAIVKDCPRPRYVDVERGEYITLPSKPKSYTLLHCAAIWRLAQVTKLFINHRADVNAKTEDGKTPIFYAIENLDLKIIKTLLIHGAVKGSGDLLNVAVRKGSIEVVEIILKYISIADMNARDELGLTPLHYAVLGAYNDIARLCLRRGAISVIYTRNITRTTLCHVVLGNKSRDLLANTTEAKMTPLHISVQNGNDKATRILLDKGANVNATKEDVPTPLHIAAYQGDERIVEILLRHDAKVDSRNDCDMTPLHLAVISDHPRIVEMLLRFGANINCADKCGNTPLLFALEKENADIVEILLHNGADINEPNKLFDLFSEIGDSIMMFYLHQIDTNSRERLAKLLIRHIVKMRKENLFIDKVYLIRISINRVLKLWYSRCIKEIEETMNKKVCDNDNTVTFYDIITKGVQQIARYASNPDIVEVFNSNKYKKMFSIYDDTIEYKFRKGQEMEFLFRSCIESFNCLCGYGLPNHFIEKMLTYLSHLDLLNLNDARPEDVSGIASAIASVKV